MESKKMRKVVSWAVFTCLLGLSLSNYTYAQTCAQPPAGLVGWWPGDGNASDIVDGNHGTLQNGATFAAGKVQQAFNFDGVDDYVNAGTSDVFNFNSGAGDFTIDAWIKLSSMPSYASGIVSKATHGPGGILSGPFSGWSFYIYADGRLGFSGNGVWEFTSVANTITLGTWYHVAITRSGNTYKLYSNSVEVGSVEHGNLETSATTLRIGSTYSDDCFFIGIIDEVAIFNRALMVSEIQAVFNAGNMGICKPYNCNITDSDNDGVIDQWDKCPNTPIGSYVDKNGCQGIGLYTEEQMNQMVSSILTWGDIDGDKKITLVEAIHALRVTSGMTVPAVK